MSSRRRVGAFGRSRISPMGLLQGGSILAADAAANTPSGRGPRRTRNRLLRFLVAAGLASRLPDAVDGDDVLLLGGVEYDHALRRAASDADAGDRHPDELPAVSHQHELVALFHRERDDQRAVARIDRHGDDAFAAAPGNAVLE